MIEESHLHDGKDHFRKVIFSSWPGKFISFSSRNWKKSFPWFKSSFPWWKKVISGKSFSQRNSFSSSKWKWKMINETHFHHRNDFSANGNGNPMAETHFHSLKVISIGPKFISIQPKVIFITQMEMTFAGGNSFPFPCWKWLSCT